MIMKNRRSFSGIAKGFKSFAKGFKSLVGVMSVAKVFGVAGVLGLLGLMMASCSSDKGAEGLPVVNICEGLDNVERVMLSEVAGVSGVSGATGAAGEATAAGGAAAGEAASIRYIPLETMEQCLVGSSHLDFEVKPGVGFFVKTMRSEVGAHFFGPDGKFIRSIGKRGRAKGEFVFNSNVVLAHDRDEIAIGSPQKTVVYNFENEFLREILYDTLASRSPFISWLQYVGNGRYANMCSFPMEEAGNPNIYMATFGDEGKMDGLYPVMEEDVSIMGIGSGGDVIEKKRFVTMGIGYTLNGESVYTRIAEDTLFKFDENFKLVPYMAFDYGMYKNLEWEKQVRFEQGGKSVKQLGDKFLFRMRGPMELSKIGTTSSLADIFYTFLMVYDMKTGNIRCVEKNQQMDIIGLENDLDGGAPFYPDKVVGKKMYQIMDAITFMEAAQNSSSARMKEVAASLTEESNPVIIEVTLK
ncbi:MAG: 6-bladed beta-propeller [Bacteroidales bacterium]|nr:6-bladed beta-propeller [Bacteroidales bacterium]